MCLHDRELETLASTQTETPGSPASVLAARACKATKADGTPCRQLAMIDSDVCFWHSDREKVCAAGRKGAHNSHERKRVVVGQGRVKLQNPEQVRALLASVVNGLRTGEMQPQVANALVKALQTSLSVIQLADLDRRLKSLEAAGKGAK